MTAEVERSSRAPQAGTIQEVPKGLSLKRQVINPVLAGFVTERSLVRGTSNLFWSTKYKFKTTQFVYWQSLIKDEISLCSIPKCLCPKDFTGPPVKHLLCDAFYSSLVLPVTSRGTSLLISEGWSERETHQCQWRCQNKTSIILTTYCLS